MTTRNRGIETEPVTTDFLTAPGRRQKEISSDRFIDPKELALG